MPLGLQGSVASRFGPSAYCFDGLWLPFAPKACDSGRFIEVRGLKAGPEGREVAQLNPCLAGLTLPPGVTQLVQLGWPKTAPDHGQYTIKTCFETAKKTIETHRRQG